MQVHKFGGASLSSVERIQNVGQVVKKAASLPTLLVISAMGKTTNALEKVAEAFYKGKKDHALELFGQLKEQHLSTAKYLLTKQALACDSQLEKIFTEAEWILHDTPNQPFDYYYDQLVCMGELMSSTLVSHYLQEVGIPNEWMDVRDVIKTDSNFRDAGVLYDVTKIQIDSLVKPALSKTGMVVTQGFIGSTEENESTTLGREGSDFTAAIFANLLDAESQTIWKDVPSVMSADPKKFPDAIPLQHLSYDEVIEMAYYGAQVIHPKTIKPLFEKKIPLLVKCFLNPELPGTTITTLRANYLPPIVVVKEDQVMIEFQSKDYSFVGEHSTGKLFALFEEMRIRPNLTQNGAIRILAVFDNREDKLQKLASAAEAFLQVMVRKRLSLITVRHYQPDTLAKLVGARTILLEQKTMETLQVVVNE